MTSSNKFFNLHALDGTASGRASDYPIHCCPAASIKRREEKEKKGQEPTQVVGPMA